MGKRRERELFAALIARAATKLEQEEAVDLAHLLLRAQEAKRKVRDWKHKGTPEDLTAYQTAATRAERYKERARVACRAAGFGLSEDLGVLQVVILEEPPAIALRSYPVP